MPKPIRILDVDGDILILKESEGDLVMTAIQEAETAQLRLDRNAAESIAEWLKQYLATDK